MIVVAVVVDGAPMQFEFVTDVKVTSTVQRKMFVVIESFVDLCLQ